MTEREQTGPTPEAVGVYYDQMGPFYATLWGNNIHVGYWLGPDDTSSNAEAQERLTDLMIDRVALTPTKRLLDVGCGTGWPAIRLAQATGGSVVGISVSAQQVARATALAEEHGVAERVQFQQADAMQLPFDDGSFDSAWAFESLLHMPDRAHVIREIWRVLRPGGMFALTDVTEDKELSPEQRVMFYASFLLNSLETTTNYPNLVSNAGFTVIEVQDIGPHTKRTLQSVSDALVEQREAMLAIYGPDLLAALEQTWPTLATIQREYLGYIVLVAQKPA